MKTYLVLLSDKCNRKFDKDLLHKHVAHLETLQQSGHLLVCGPFADDKGAMLVLNAANDSTVEKLVLDDPFIQEKYYSNYSIAEIHKADASNNYLMQHP